MDPGDQVAAGSRASADGPVAGTADWADLAERVERDRSGRSSGQRRGWLIAWGTGTLLLAVVSYPLAMRTTCLMPEKRDVIGRTLYEPQLSTVAWEAALLVVAWTALLGGAYLNRTMDRRSHPELSFVTCLTFPVLVVAAVGAYSVATPCDPLFEILSIASVPSELACAAAS